MHHFSITEMKALFLSERKGHDDDMKGGVIQMFNLFFPRLKLSFRKKFVAVAKNYF